MSYVVAAEPPEVPLPITLVDDVLACNELLTAEDKLSVFRSKLQLDWSTIQHVADVTAGQRDNPLRGKIRHKRLTASHFGNVLAAINRNSFPPSLFKQLGGLLYYIPIYYHVLYPNNL
jgi:hypothetical protein